jgi:proteasome lid subunit RPN8/RPN11
VRLVVPAELLSRMRAHGEEMFPHECCGFMLGAAVDGEQRIVEVRAQANERTESRENRFVISPGQFRDAEKRARAAGLLLVGIYHSHPDSPARPSEYDRDHAWPWFSYLIVSVRGGKAAETNAWRLRDDRSGFDPVALEVAPAGPAGVPPAAATKGDRE